MKYLFVLMFLVASVVTISNAQDYETRSVPEFDGVKASHGIEVILQKGSSGTVEVETRHIDPDDIETYVSRGILRIKFKNMSIWNWDDRRYGNRDVKVTVNYDELIWIESNTGAIVISRNVIKGENMRLEASTGGEMELELDVTRIEADFTMGSVVEVKGQARILRIKASMGAEVDFRNLDCEIVDARGNMGAVLAVTASKEADVSANMGAVINIYGSPERRYKSHSFGGEIDFVGHN